LRQVEELSLEAPPRPLVIFGSEGCGKTAFLRQATAMLKETSYDVPHLHPLDRAFPAEVDDAEVKSPSST